MLLPKFEFHEPKSIGEACEIMAFLQGSAKPIAGGTDLLVNMKKKGPEPRSSCYLCHESKTSSR